MSKDKPTSEKMCTVTRHCGLDPQSPDWGGCNRGIPGQARDDDNVNAHEYKLRLAAPYMGLPLIALALLWWQIGRVEAFTLLQQELLIIFGYLAALSDLKEKKISNTLVLAMLASWLITFLPQLFVNTAGALLVLLEAALGFAISGGIFLFVYLISRQGLGGGDVKFMAAAGLYLGFSGVLPVIFCGALLAGVTALGLMLFKRLGSKDTMPLAPFLYLGILITLFFL